MTHIGKRSDAIAVGAEAPDFELRDQHGQTVRLSSYRGKTAVLLVFYPFALTGICGGELRDLQKSLDTFQTGDVTVLALSTDSMYAQRAFADREGFTFALLADFWPHGGTARAFGVFSDQTGAAQRATFLIDRHGVVRWSVLTSMDQARDLQAYRQALTRL